MHILYVEDNETNQALVGRVLRGRQHVAVFREDGEAALELLANDAAIELVLLDVELAGTMNGMDVIKALRKRGDRRPVVAVTAYAMMGDRERILKAGCDQYLPKPLSIRDLLAVLDEYASREVVPGPAEKSAPAAQPAAPPTPPDAPTGATALVPAGETALVVQPAAPSTVPTVEAAAEPNGVSAP